MTHRAARVFLVLVAFAAAGGAGYFLWKLDTRERTVREAARRYDGEAERALLLVERLRAAQQSYVAEGQGPHYWMTRAAETLDSLERSLTTLAGTTEVEELRQGARAASITIEEIRKLDTRAREWIRGGDRLMASDLIFTEALAATGTLAAALGTLRDRQLQIAEGEIADVRQKQLYATSIGAALCLVAVLLLAPAVKVVTPRDTREALKMLLEGTPTPGSTVRDSGARPALQTAAQPAPASQSAASQATTVRPATARPAAPPAPAPAAPRFKPIDVAAAAKVCGDLARVVDPGDLPGLLERAADLLDASGLIVWVGDRAGESLYPMLAHGYPPAVLSKMGSLHREDDNATAAAYRNGEPAVVPAKNGTPGAIVTPIVSPDGCVGVLAVEIRGGAEEDGERRALAGILAAQLATLVTALPAPERAIQARG
ncbi:MAG TPA: GAF domain-containing protein [Vicinamibacterales bacterium]|nr:GAF domain-containing protein [Vicinamibacterales bacterium]